MLRLWEVVCRGRSRGHADRALAAHGEQSASPVPVLAITTIAGFVAFHLFPNYPGCK
ncbi:MAG: hypothetical protein QME71_03125 [Dehalococcoidia bacterium]|nr:hypothetical protein [Dehalococcoidia bacterium]